MTNDEFKSEILTWRSQNQMRSSTADNPDFADVFSEVRI
jgi:hypothetical protein